MAENEKVEAQAAETAKAASAKAAKPAKAKAKKPSLVSRIAAWFRSVKAETKKIVWTSPAAVRQNSIMVLVVVLIFAAATGVVDLIFSKFFYILGILL